MKEPLRLPRQGRSVNFMADYTLQEEHGDLIATEGWIHAPNKGSEIMQIIISEFQAIATTRNRKLIHRYEASTPQGRKLIQKYPQYRWAGRSSDHNPIYEKEYLP